MGILSLVALASLASLSLVSLSLSSTMCDNALPGIKKMFRGVDITELEMMSKTSNGFRKRILKLTCDKGTKLPNDEIQIPDQVWHTSQIPAGWLSNQVSFYKSYEDVRKDLSVGVSADAATDKMAFSGSVSYKQTQKQITENTKKVTDIAAFDAGMRVHMLPSWALQMDKGAKQLINKTLTGKYSRGFYEKFIKEYGTHFFSVGLYGGYIKARYEIDTDVFNSATEHAVEADAKRSVMGALTISVHVDATDKKENSKVSDSSETTITYYGGSTNLLNKTKFDKWTDTVDKSPWLVSGQLKPISELIEDRIIKTAMKEAVAQYIMVRYLEELVRLTNYITTSRKCSTLRKTIKHVQKMHDTNEKRLVESEVSTLGQLVKKCVT